MSELQILHAGDGMTWIAKPSPLSTRAISCSSLTRSTTCSNVLNLLYDPERRIPVEWDKGADGTPYTVRLTVHVEDRKGILADVSSKVAGVNTNIRNIEATVDDQMGRIDMTVEISDVKHLQKVIKSLRSIAGVVDVERASR